MQRSLDEYRQIASRLLMDKPIRELGTGKILCYRKPDEKEVAANEAMVELLSVIDSAKTDLETFAVCGTCSHLRLCKNRYEKKGRGQPSIDHNAACYKWKWRGDLIDSE